MDIPDEKKVKLREWLLNFVDMFRHEYEGLSEEQKSRMQNAYNYLPPTQLEVIWLKQPEFQSLIVSHFKDKRDLEITIDGPYEGHEYIDRVEQRLRQAPWNKEILADERFIIIEKGLTYGHVIASRLYNHINQIKNSIFQQIEIPRAYGGMRVTSDSFIFHYAGNISDLDYKAEVNKIITQLKREPVPAQPSPSLQNRIKGLGVYFYPLVLVGERPERTIHESLLGFPLLHFTYRDKIFDEKFFNYRIIVNKDGFLGIGSDDKQKALKMFNTIMGVALLEGIPTTAIRENELADIDIDIDSYTIGGSSMEVSTPRNIMSTETRAGFGIFGRSGRTQVTEEKMKKIIRISEEISQDSKKAENVVFLLESSTHLRDLEYAQAFTMSWIIIEKYLSRLWENYLKQKNISGERKDKLTNPIFWPVDSYMETLNLNGLLNDEDYKLLNRLKKKRNDFIHKGHTIVKEDAISCYELALAVTKTDLSL